MKTKNQNTSFFKYIWNYIKRKKISFFGFIFVAFLIAIQLTLGPYFIKKIIDTMNHLDMDLNKVYKSVSIPVFSYVFLNIISNINYRLYDFIGLNTYPYLKSLMIRDIYYHLLKHSFSFFQEKHTGNITKKVFDLSDGFEILVRMINETFLPTIFSICISSILLWVVVDKTFAIILLSWSVLFVFASYFISLDLEKSSFDFAKANAKSSGEIADSISNIINIKLFSYLKEEKKYVNKILDELVSSDEQLHLKNLKVNFVQGIGISLLLTLMILTLVYYRIYNNITVGDFALVLMLSIAILMNVFNIGQQIQQFIKILGACKNSLNTILVPNNYDIRENKAPLIVNKGKIEFSNVFFSYPEQKNIFENINLTINSGEKIGIVGHSGAGKSTFIKLILGLIEYNQGKILIDDQPIHEYKHSSLIENITIVPQEPKLFHRSIIDNIRIAKSNANDDEVVRASVKAGCHNFIDTLPEKYNTNVGEQGIKLSGGQKQMISIARGLLKNAPIVILDEATSAIDSKSENYIKKSLNSLTKNKTTIIIAHRLSTLKDVDKIIVFEKGKIVETGNFKSLFNKNSSYFRRLWDIQSNDYLLK